MQKIENLGYFKQVGFDTPDEDVEWLRERHTTKDSEELLVFKAPNYHKDDYRPPENLPEDYRLSCDTALDMELRQYDYELKTTIASLREELHHRAAMK